MNRLEHNLVCDGRGAVFSLDGKYVSDRISMTNTGRPVDVISLLQQGNLGEIAILCNGAYHKQGIDIEKFQAWVNMIPVRPKATLRIRRAVGNEKCTQTLYVFDLQRVNPYLNTLLNG